MGADKQAVTVHIRFKPSGEVEGTPEVMGGKASEIAGRNAVNAVLSCQPFPLPPEKYASWKDVILDFDPQRMYR